MSGVALEDRLNAPTPGVRRESPAFLAFASLLRRAWRVGALTLTGPAGGVSELAGPEAGARAELHVRDGGGFLRRVATRGDLGFADSFIAGEWDTPDLALTLRAFAVNLDTLGQITRGGRWLRLAQAFAHALNRNSRKGARRNIHAHYDLGEDFYRLWLDEGLNYSSTRAFQPGASLEAAQADKHAALARRMELGRGMRVLEIGCGWGGFALFAAREYDARVTALTISQAQHDHARARVQAAGLNERVEVVLQDYRDAEGSFDRVASIEMFEAVGEAYWPAYFRCVHDRLQPGGRAGLQVITIDAALFDAYRRRPDFIQLHVFPGGMLPSEARLREEVARVGLRWTGEERFGQGYAATLAEWGRRYRAQAPAVAALGFDARFDRTWRYYLAYCEAGFRTGRTDVMQIGLSRD